jgi:hypothetical protein
VSVAKAEAELTVRFDTDATNADVLLAVNAVLTSNRSVSVLVDGDQT